MSHLTPVKPNISIYQLLINERDRFKNELEQVVQKIKKITESGIINVFKGRLTEEQLPQVLSDPLIRKYLVLSFNHVVDSKIDLKSIREEDLSNLCEYHNKNVKMMGPLQGLQSIANQYMEQFQKETRGVFHFGVVVEHLQTISSRNLTDFELPLLQVRKTWLEMSLKFAEENLQTAQETAVNCQSFLKTNVADCTRGNFDFIIESSLRKMVKTAFDAIEKADLWHKIPKENPITYETINNLNKNPELAEIVKIIEQNDDVKPHWTLTQIIHMNRMGWDAFRDTWIKNSYPNSTAAKQLEEKSPP